MVAMVALAVVVQMMVVVTLVGLVGLVIPHQLHHHKEIAVEHHTLIAIMVLGVGVEQVL
jgi:hypothetical protein